MTAFKTIPRTALVLAFGVLLSACAQLAEKAARDDAQAVRSLAQANLAQIAAGKLASSNARLRAVRQYGQRMVREHTRLQAEASELRSAKGVPLPTRPDEGQEAALRKLEKRPREGFDAAYMAQMVEDHLRLLRLLERTASRATDPALRLHAQRALPQVRQHLDLAKRLAGEAVGRGEPK